MSKTQEKEKIKPVKLKILFSYILDYRHLLATFSIKLYTTGMTYLAKLGELTLKGSNLQEFENLLKHNTAACLSGLGCKISLMAGRLYIDCDDSAAEKVEFTLNHLLGITGWAKATVCEKTIEAINDAVYENAKIQADKGCKTFKIDARRSDKGFPLTSYQICCESAGRVEQLMKVDVHKPDCTIYVEVRERVFVYTDSETGCRGLPVGSSSKGLLLLSGGLDSFTYAITFIITESAVLKLKFSIKSSSTPVKYSNTCSKVFFSRMLGTTSNVEPSVISR